jgi:hypothetical protein
MDNANATAIAGGALCAALLDHLVTKGILDETEVGNIIAAAKARLAPLQGTDTQAARNRLSSIASMYSGLGRNV